VSTRYAKLLITCRPAAANQDTLAIRSDIADLYKTLVSARKSLFVLRIKLAGNCCLVITLVIDFHTAPTPTNDPCQPSPCGPNSNCLNVNGKASCSCLPTYQGTPPACKPECIISTECPTNRACINQRCVDPCPGVCGINARCDALSHSPFCSCPPGRIGDPFVKCFDMPCKP